MRVTLACVALLSLGCSQTQIVVFLDRSLDDAPPLELERITLTVTPADPADYVLEPPYPELPLRVGIEPAGRPDAEITIAATARIVGEAEALSVRRRVRFVEGQTFPVPITFYRRCLGVSCPAGQTCDASAGAPVCIDEVVACGPDTVPCPDRDAGPTDSDAGPGLPDGCDGLDDDGDGRIDEDAPCPRPIGLALGHDHTCQRRGADALCWGLNHEGRLHDGSLVSRSLPARVVGTWIELAAGYDFTCGIDERGGVQCWGANDHGQLWDPDPLVTGPSPVETEPAARLAAGDGFACQIASEGGAVQCWGRNDRGQLGVDRAGKIVVEDAVEIAAGRAHACALLRGGRLRCWGDNAEGQVSGSVAEPTPSPTATPVLDAAVMAVATGGQHTCAIVGSPGASEVTCWGDASAGQTAAATIDDPVELALGRDFSCARTAAGDVLCWGSNRFGALGTSDAVDVQPVTVANVANARALAAGVDHVCAETREGVYCWGYGGAGQLGRGANLTPGIVNVPADAGLANPSDVRAGDRATCASDESGAVFCWGEGRRGRIGDGALGSRPAPTPVIQSGGGALRVAGGRLAMGHAGRAYGVVDGSFMWGFSADGRLGSVMHGRHLDAAGLTTLGPSGMSPYLVALGHHHGCAIQDNTALYCFGTERSGERGDGMPDSAVGPTWVDPMGEYRAVAVGRYHSCGLEMGGLKCWGSNARGQLARTVMLTSADVPGPPDELLPSLGSLLGAGRAHTCVTTNESFTSRALCVGDNSRGQHGANPVSGSSDAFVPVPRIVGRFVELRAGDAFTCARLTPTGATDEDVQCWGANEHGQLGFDGGPGANRVPLPVTMGDGIKSLAVGYDHACAVVGTTVYCWGSDADGALGTGRPLFSGEALPVDGTMP